MTFLATFAPAALLPLIRENLSLTKTQTGLAGVYATKLSYIRATVSYSQDSRPNSCQFLTFHVHNLSGVTAVLGAVFGRIFMGTVLDTLGPRFGNAIVMLMFAPPVFLISMIVDGGGFEAIRLFIGMSLCCFVCCQYWVGTHFNVRIVGTANAIAAGW